MKAKTVTLAVNALELCDRTRSRKNKPKEGSDIVQEYAEAYEAGLILEPLDVFCEKGSQRYIVADGEHRLLALRRAKIKEVECRVHEGGEIDALRFALQTNQAHGLRLTKEDRYYRFCRIKETALEKEFRTDKDISDALGVSISTVQRYGVQWRNSESGNKKARRKKAEAKERAAKKTRKDLRGGADDSNDIIGPPLINKENSEKAGTFSQTEENPFEASPPAPKTSGWTAADDHTFKGLRAAWNRATPAAREKFKAEVAG